MDKVLSILIIALCLLCANTVLAQDAPSGDAGPVASDGGAEEVPAPAPDDPALQEPDPLGLMGELYVKITSGEWLAALGGMLMLLVLALRLLLTKILKVSFFGTRIGGYILNFGAALGIAVGSAVLAGMPINLGLVSAAIAAAFAASGGWETLNDALGGWVRSKISA